MNIYLFILLYFFMYRWDHTLELIDGDLWVFGGMWTENLYTGERFNGSHWNLEQLSKQHMDSSSAVISCQ